MSEPVRWPLEPHTAAKHRVLRSYLDGWVGVMGHQSLKARRAGDRARLLLVDGFAGPGRYEHGEPGSPLIMLDSVISHGSFSQFADVEFNFLFIEHDPRRVESLRAKLSKVDQPDNLSVTVVPGEFEEVFASVVDPIIASGRQLIPTFAFIDPFGYSGASMSLTGKLLDFPRCETLFFLPMSFIHRFVGRDGQATALDSLFGTEEWRNAIPLQGADRTALLLELFERQLRSGRAVECVRSFRLHTDDGQDYRLVFGLGHRKGLEIAKDAMWRVDPVAGTSYVATTESGQDVLFSPEELLDTGPLLRELRAKFGEDWFTIEQAEDCTLLDTPFRVGHLRERTLRPAEEDGILEVRRPGTRGFKAATMRFLPGAP